MIYSIEFPNEKLKETVLAEYAALSAQKTPSKMRLSRMAISAAKLTTTEREKIISELAKYSETDLICYREAEDQELIALQNSVWNPAVEWAEKNLQISLQTTSGIMPTPQNIPHATQIITEFNNWQLIPLSILITACGSFILGIMTARQALTAAEATAASLLEYTYQQERWGLDDEEIDRQKELAETIQAAAKFLTLLI